jgi:hypothetical protein
MNQQTVKALRTETEQLWLIAVRARRAAAAKGNEYRAALLEWWDEVEIRRRQDERQRDN